MTRSVTEAIRVSNVGFVYPDGTRALRGVNLTITRGESVAIIGQNGSGKSTLVRLLNGLLRPTEGRVSLFDHDTAGAHVADLARTTGLVFQNPDRQIFAASVRAEVAFGPRNLGRKGTELDHAVEAALTAVGLEVEANTNPYDLGFSRRKLLALASILAMETPIVIIDEPTTGQDARGVRRIQQLVDSLAADGRTVIAISHDMGFVAESFRRVVVLRGGSVSLDGSPETVFGEGAWPTLAATSLRPTFPAEAGARLGLGATPTEASFVGALRTRLSSRRRR